MQGKTRRRLLEKMMLRKYAQGIVFAILAILHFGLPQEHAGFRKSF